ncbi:MAG TPA: pentapeptide repeat-containing protein [Myxococcaceae bacterium]|nr:pentapeptide repeat-containing protein [Myxococcaceae bacterium]
MEILSAIKILGKALQLGLSGAEALITEGLDLKELAAVPALTDLVGEFGRKKGDRSPDLDAQLLGIITRCFGQAIKRHWAYNPSLAPSPSRLRLFMSKEEAKRAAEIEQRLELALRALKVLGPPGDLPAGPQEWKHVESLTGNPLSTPYYRALWKAFTDSKLDDPEDPGPPLIDLSLGARPEFEHYFLLAYYKALSSAEGQPLQEYQQRLSGDYLGRLLRELLLRDIATWDRRHIFGNTEQRDWSPDTGIPFMSLGQMYVEPDAYLAGSTPKVQGPVTTLIQNLMESPQKNVIIVKADFGMGKSLTARALAQRWAQRYLSAPESSPELIEPVFIRCAEDLTGESFDLDQTVRRAWKRQASALGLDLKARDQALSPPDKKQRVVFLIDGLDEVVLDERRMDDFFKRLREDATSHHRFIVLSRPGALPSEQGLKDIPVIDLKPWGDKQIDTWLAHWRQVSSGQGPTFQQLRERQLATLASTPILLFMVAQTWSRNQGMGTSLAALYEEFFWQIAKGKHDKAGEHHQNILESSSKLLKQLIRLRLIDKSAEEPDAMLWLMGRIAWEATKREQRRKYFGEDEPAELTAREIENLIEEELKLREAPDALRAIQVGLLLTMQAHLSAGKASRLLFGHKSFREYLTARYWSDRLNAIVHARERDWDELEEPLLEGRLLSREDRTFDFLLEMLNGQPLQQHPRAPFGLKEQEHKTLLEWAQHRFESEEQRFPPRRSESLREDRMPWLREAALAIGSGLNGSDGIGITNPLTVRSMLAWFWLMRIGPIIIAPKAQWINVVLSELNLRGADFRGADLRGADFDGANLRVRTSGSYGPCDFTGAKLDRASMLGAVCNKALFIRASLDEAVLEEAQFILTNFTEASLEGANLNEANLHEATLTRARLDFASFLGASLQGADLREASLQSAFLFSADLRGAVLDGALLDGARYDRATQWPEGFDPEARGAILDEEDV